jgi:hypothetical protein
VWYIFEYREAEYDIISYLLLYLYLLIKRLTCLAEGDKRPDIHDHAGGRKEKKRDKNNNNKFSEIENLRAIVKSYYLLKER